MSPTIGVRELKNSASGIIRSIREEGTEYVVTLRGKPVAILRRLSEDDRQRLRTEQTDRAIDEIDSLASRIGDAWTSDMTAAEAVDDQRRG